MKKKKINWTSSKLKTFSCQRHYKESAKNKPQTQQEKDKQTN